MAGAACGSYVWPSGCRGVVPPTLLSGKSGYVLDCIVILTLISRLGQLLEGRQLSDEGCERSTALLIRGEIDFEKWTSNIVIAATHPRRGADFFCSPYRWCAAKARRPPANFQVPHSGYGRRHHLLAEMFSEVVSPRQTARNSHHASQNPQNSATSSPSCLDCCQGGWHFVVLQERRRSPGGNEVRPAPQPQQFRPRRVGFIS